MVDGGTFVTVSWVWLVVTGWATLIMLKNCSVNTEWATLFEEGYTVFVVMNSTGGKLSLDLTCSSHWNRG